MSGVPTVGCSGVGTGSLIDHGHHICGLSVADAKACVGLGRAANDIGRTAGHSLALLQLRAGACFLGLRKFNTPTASSLTRMSASGTMITRMLSSEGVLPRLSLSRAPFDLHNLTHFMGLCKLPPPPQGLQRKRLVKGTSV